MFAQFADQRAGERGGVADRSRAGTLRTPSWRGPSGAIFEAEVRQRLGVFLGGGDIQRVGGEHGGDQQRLGGDLPVSSAFFSFS